MSRGAVKLLHAGVSARRSAPSAFPMRRALLLAAAAWIVALPAAGQAVRVDSILPGDYVRVLAPAIHPHPITGEVLHYYGDSLGVRESSTGTAYTIPIDGIQRLAKNQGMNRGRSVWHAARLGMFLGTSLGIVSGPLISMRLKDDNFERTTLFTSTGGAVVGLGLGAAFGSLFAREHWQAYRMPGRNGASVGPAPGGGTAVSITLPAP